MKHDVEEVLKVRLMINLQVVTPYNMQAMPENRGKYLFSICETAI